MQEISILVLGTNEAIVKTLERIINKQAAWNALIALNTADFYQHCSNYKFDVVLIGAGFDKKTEIEIQKHLYTHQKCKIVKHYGGGSGLLYAEIYQALAS